ncbi:hypothetical protein [Kitasatospora sp. NPDC088548]|uniref:hypothetical protein n=1 Tax=Kitasatospora sp. NPDC088548 TaxID=3364075 RepID=UPI0037F83FD1
MAARAALRGIEESARAALEDLDYVLGVLREEEPGTAPARTLEDLPELLDRLRCAGAVVEPELSGDLARVRLLHGETEAGPDGPRHWRLAVRLPA